MAELLIRYVDAEGNATERRVSDIEPDGRDHISAFCHERQEGRTFKISRIASAIDAETGEVIEDLYGYLGVENPDKPKPMEPEPIPRTPAEIQKRRGADKRRLFKPFVLSALEEHARRRFFAFFGNACFKCGSPGPLVIDHHVPIVLGGRLVPGNLVALCKRCNDSKQDKPPEKFYSSAEMERLQGFLGNQEGLFDFKFDRDAWEADREAYLLSLGVDPGLVREALHDPRSRFYIEPREEREGMPAVEIVIDMNTDEMRDIIRKVLTERESK